MNGILDPIAAAAVVCGLVGFIVGMLPGFICGATYAHSRQRAVGVGASDGKGICTKDANASPGGGE